MAAGRRRTKATVQPKGSRLPTVPAAKPTAHRARGSVGRLVLFVGAAILCVTLGRHWLFPQRPSMSSPVHESETVSHKGAAHDAGTSLDPSEKKRREALAASIRAQLSVAMAESQERHAPPRVSDVLRLEHFSAKATDAGARVHWMARVRNLTARAIHEFDASVVIHWHERHSGYPSVALRFRGELAPHGEATIEGEPEFLPGETELRLPSFVWNVDEATLAVERVNPSPAGALVPSAEVLEVHRDAG